jgi:hypothetical protein
VPAQTRPSWHRRAPLAALVLAVLAAHALLLAGVTTGQDGRSTDSRPGRAPLQVRQIVVPVAVAPVPARPRQRRRHALRRLSARQPGWRRLLHRP